VPDIRKFPDYFRAYHWSDKHALYGYPPDTFGDFEWIASLERRFEWLRANHAAVGTASLYLIREMIQWGGSQNGVLQKFDERLGETHLYALMADVMARIGDPAGAIEAALQIPGMGLTYASKLLRFIAPEHYGALDSRVRGAIEKRLPSADIPKIYDGNANSMINGYVAFTRYLARLRHELDKGAIARPDCRLKVGTSSSGWRAADIEMALFRWAESGEA